jgi:hypothetical protein
MSALCQQRTYSLQQFSPLFDHLVGAAEQRQRERETQGFRGLEIKH